MGDKSLEEMTAETLSGDLRDVMLTHIRSMQTPWSKLSEQAQQDRIDAISNACETIVTRAVALIAERKFSSVHCSVTKFTVKDLIKAEINAVSSSFNIETIAEGIGEPALLIFASAETFIGEKAAAKPDKDQPSLPIDHEGEEEPETAGLHDVPVPSDDDGSITISTELPDADPSDAPEAA